ncbi:MAG: TonB-dependent receptor [Prevotella sp.]|nr:TonB-dependent receptor [Prevotella sp.]
MSETITKVRYGLVGLLLFFCAAVQAQTISGNVKDANGEPVIGATIMEQGTQNGTVTDFDGNFTLKLQKGGNINVSYVGMKSQVIKTAGKSSVNVTLEDDNTTLNDLVVVGYGTMKKSDLTGSVSSVNTEQLNAKGASTVLGNLQGSTPGVNITTSGRVGESASIEIRGKSSINKDVSPLYVVDGVFCDDIDWLNPQDIEKIDILKDASSTAIYGSRATAGVVMVTTKSGTTVKKDQKPTVSYDGYYGWTKAARMPDFYDANGYAHYRFMKFLTTANALTDVSGNPVYGMTYSDYGTAMLQRNSGDASQGYAMKDMLAAGVDIDWPDLVTRTGTQQNHYLSVSGSGKGLAYNFGLGYNAEKGIYVGDDQQKVNFKGAIDTEINKYFKAGFSFNASYQDLSQADSESITEAFRMTPFSRPYDENGNFILKPGSAAALGTDNNQFTDTYNSLMKMQNNENQQTTWRLLGNAYLQFEPMKGLTFKTTFSPNYKNVRKGNYTGFINPVTADADGNAKYYNPDSKTNGYAYNHNSNVFAWTWDNVVNYNTRFGQDKHSLGVMGLYSVQKSTSEVLWTGAKDLNEDILWWNMNAGTYLGNYKSDDDVLKNYGMRNYYSSYSMTSWAARVNYGYLDRYLLTATVRWDGSSKFAKDNRWGCFPSVALAWRMSEEEFIKKIDWISNLKLRVSYGVTGNCDGVDNYATLSTRSDGSVYAFGTNKAMGYEPSAIVDKNLKWEKSHEWNFGLDFGFLRNRIMGSIDFYTKKSKDLLYKVQLPLVAGGGSMMTNVGSVRNTGVEISLTTVNIKKKDWEWTTTFNFSHNKNEVKEINGQDNYILSDDIITGSLFVGSPVNNVYAYDFLGVVSDRMMTLNDRQIETYTQKLAEKGHVNKLSNGQIREYDYYYTVYGQGEGGVKCADFDDDGTYDKKVFSSDPVWTGSFTSNLSWKNWDFSMSLYAKVNYKVYSPFMHQYGRQSYRGMQRIDMDYYIPAGTLIGCDGINEDGTYINPVYQTSTHYADYPFIGDGGNNKINKYIGQDTDEEYSLAVVNGTFVKCKNMTLGYTFPKSWLSSWGCSYLRLYFTVTNPFTFTGYKGFDPEWAGASNSKDVPSTVTYQLGASIKF